MKRFIKSHNLISILYEDITSLLNMVVKINQKIANTMKLFSYEQFENIHESVVKIKEELKKIEKLL